MGHSWFIGKTHETRNDKIPNSRKPGGILLARGFDSLARMIEDRRSQSIGKIGDELERLRGRQHFSIHPVVEDDMWPRQGGEGSHRRPRLWENRDEAELIIVTYCEGRRGVRGKMQIGRTGGAADRYGRLVQDPYKQKLRRLFGRDIYRGGLHCPAGQALRLLGVAGGMCRRRMCDEKVSTDIAHLRRQRP